MDELIRAMEMIGDSVPVFQNPGNIAEAIETLQDNMVVRDRFDNSWLDSISEGYGIILIEGQFENMNTSDTAGLRRFAREWNTIKSIDTRTQGYHRSRCYTGRIDSLGHEETKLWVPLVISQAKNLRERVTDHVFTPTNDQTWSIRLGNRNAAVDRIQSIRVGTIELPISENAYHAIHLLKAELIEQIHPIFGR